MNNPFRVSHLVMLWKLIIDHTVQVIINRYMILSQNIVRHTVNIRHMLQVRKWIYVTAFNTINMQTNNNKKE